MIHMIRFRTYSAADGEALEMIHDRARKIELHLAGLDDAFLPLRIAAEREGLWEYPGLFVAELDGRPVGFLACTEEELAWLYVDPAYMRQGIGRTLALHAMREFPRIHAIEVLKGNEPARALYESLGFHVTETETGQMPGNEKYQVTVYLMER